MAHFQTHCDDCMRILGDRYESTHLWLDQLFAKFGASHRRWRHHEGGVAEAHRRGLSWRAAIIHIVRDHGYVPRETDFITSRFPHSAEELLYDSVDQTARAKFDAAVASEIQRLSARFT